MRGSEQPSAQPQWGNAGRGDCGAAPGAEVAAEVAAGGPGRDDVAVGGRVDPGTASRAAEQADPGAADRIDAGAVFCAVDSERCVGLPVPQGAGTAGGARSADGADGADGAGGADSAGGAGGSSGACRPAGPAGLGGSGDADQPAVCAAGPDVSAAGRGVGVALAEIRRGIAGLREVPLWTLGQQDLVALARDVEAAVRSAFGAQVRLAGEISERGIAGMLDVRSAAHLLHQTLNITMSDARGRVAAAKAGLPTETVTGAVVAPPAPQLLDAIDAGAICGEHARVITGCLGKIPPAVDAATRDLCCETLIEQAARTDPVGLRQVAEQIRLITDPDGTMSGTDPAERAEMHIGAQRRDGLTPFGGLLDPLTAEHLRVAIQALAGPKPVDEHTPDPRPAGLRRAQALAEILHRHLTAGAGPRDGGVRPQVVITIGIEDLLGHTAWPPCPHHDGHTTRPASPDRTGGDHSGGPDGGWLDDVADLFNDTNGPLGNPSHDTACDTGRDTGGGPRAGRFRSATTGIGWFDYGGVTDPAIARMLACDAALIPQVLGSDSVVLDQGRAVRLFTAEQRRAITTRDRGCAFPGCDIPPAWCEAHHIIWWSRGGTTDITRGVLLCRRHHVIIHQGNWRINAADHGGRPEFIPPPHIDPAQQPRRNTHFHLPESITPVRRQ